MQAGSTFTFLTTSKWNPNDTDWKAPNQKNVIFINFPEFAIRDFKQRQPGRRRERHRIRENPKTPLRMTGGEQVDVLRLDPTRV